MTCRGVHFALTREEESAVLAADSDAGVLMIVQEQIEEEWDVARLCETDTAWDAIHRCLTGGSLIDDGTVLSKCVLGGNQLHRGDEYIINFRNSSEVADVTAALEPIGKVWMLHRYRQIGSHGYEGPIGEDDFEYTWDHFDALREFYRSAARAGRSVLFSVDQ